MNIKADIFYLLALTSAISLLAGTSSPASQLKYAVTDLGEGNAIGINRAGSILINKVFRSFVLRRDSTSLFVGPKYGVAVAINDRGDVVGVGSNDSLVKGTPYLWKADGSVVYFEGNNSSSLNNNGDVTITYQDNLGVACGSRNSITVNKAYAVLGGIRIEINNLDGSSQHVDSDVRGVNDDGEFVGTANATDCTSDRGQVTPFWYHNGHFSKLPSDSNPADALFINKNEQIVGDLNNGHAYILAGTTNIDIGTLGGSHSDPKGLNDKGDVVGSSVTNDFSTPTHAFLYTGNKLNDVNALIVDAPTGLILTEAVGINDSGQILCQGVLNNVSKVFRLDPKGQ